MYDTLTRLLLAPDAADGGAASDGASAGSSAGTENTGSPAGAENTGSGQQSRPTSGADDVAQRERVFRSGMARGVAKTLRDLGLDTDDLEEARALLDSMRTATDDSQGQRREPATDGRGGGADVDAAAKLAEMRAASARLERDLQRRERELESLRARADVARQLAIQHAAISAGVGAGRQAEAFVRLYGDRFSLDDRGELQALVPGSDGEPVPGIVDVADLVAELAQDAPFLLARSTAAGAGSRQAPTGASPTEADAAAERSKKLWGVGGGDSKLATLLKRGRG